MKTTSIILALLLASLGARAEITVTVAGSGGRVVDTVPDAGGAFEVNLPLNRNAVNTIRVTATDSFGNTDAAELAVTQVALDEIVVSRLSTERLSQEEVEQWVSDGVIQLDDPANYNVSRFTIVLTIDKQEIPISLPVVFGVGASNDTGYEHYRLPEGDDPAGRPPPPPPPEIIVFLQELKATVEGEAIPPVPGVIIIEGRIKSLKEFFSVRLMLLNTSGIFTLTDVVAELTFPDGGLTAILPADGIADLGDILPGSADEPGQIEREFIVRGDQTGVRDVEVHFGGVVTGPGIPADDPIPFNGSAVADVEVLGPPEFLVKVQHPDSVTAGEPYALTVEIQNAGALPALYASLDLDVSADARLAECTIDPVTGNPDCVYVSRPVTRLFGHIQPGEWVSETFTVLPLVSGAVSSCVGASDQNITLQVAVGNLGCVTGHFPPEQDVPLGVPSVTVVPAPNTQFVSTDTPVAAFFSERMRRSTITTGEGGSFNVFDAAGDLVSGQLRIETNLFERTIAIWQKPGGLRPGEEYTVWVTTAARDLDGQGLFSEWVSTFKTTTPGAGDFDPPLVSVSIESPVDPNYILPGERVPVNAYATDQGSGVARVELRMKDLDGTNLLYQLVDQKTVFAGNAPPFVFALDSGNLTPGHAYQLLCSAYDGRGNVGSATVSILVAPNANPPVIVLPDDPAGNVLHGISVRLSPVSLIGGVRRVRYYLDGAPEPFKTVTLAPFQATLSTLNLSLTNHTITAIAEDGLGQTGQDAYAFTLAENINMPAVRFPGSVDGAVYVLGELISVNPLVEDPVGLRSVDVFVSSPETMHIGTNADPVVIDTTLLGVGAHRVSVVATNRLGVANDPSDPDSHFEFTVIEPPPGPPPAPPVVNDVSAPSVDGMVSVTGTATPNARVDVVNTTLGLAATTDADAAGHYTAIIGANAGDRLEFMSTDLPTSPDPSTATVIQVPAPPVVIGTTVAPPTLAFTAANQHADIVVTAQHAGGGNANVSRHAAYTSSQRQVASVNAAGRVVPVKSGSASIRVSYAGFTREIPVTVNIRALTNMTVAPPSVTLRFPTDIAQLAVIGLYSDGTSNALSGGVSFATQNPSVATVNASGRVTGGADGQTQIVISAPGLPPQYAQVRVDNSLNPPPAVQISSPTNGAPVERNQPVDVWVRGLDPTGGVVRLDLAVSGETSFADSRAVGASADVTRLLTFTVDSNAAVGGAIALSATATDVGGKISPVERVDLTVVDTTAPQVSILTPTNDTPYNDGDTIELRVQASDAVGVSRVRFLTEGGLVAEGVTNLTPVAGVVDVTFQILIPPGSPSPDVTLRVFAQDAAGNEGEALPVAILLTDADITPPETMVTDASATIGYLVTDGIEDLAYVLLYFRRDDHGTFNLYVDDTHPTGQFIPQSGANGTIPFDAAKTGGDGTYEFYTVGVDDHGNREAPPPVADDNWTFAEGTVWTILSSDTTIGIGNTLFDNQDLRVDGVLLSVNGHHAFHNLELVNGATLTHPAATATTEPGVDVTCWSLTVDATSVIDVNARGYLGAWREDNTSPQGLTLGNTPGSTYRSGGSYGGLGGELDGSANPQYGSLVTPFELGSGGSEGVSDARGGDGGGRIRIQAIHVLHDGLMSANGANGAGNGAGSGSGGSVYLTVSSFSGAGVVRANGAAHEVGGGGGRIAIHHVDMATYDSDLLAAIGGIGNSRAGGDGTVFLKSVNEAGGTLVVDGQGAAASFSTLPIPTGYVFDNIVIRNSARVVADDPLVVSNRLSVTTGSILTHSLEQESGLRIEAAQVVVDATSSIDVSGRGYRGAWQDGNATPNGLTLHGQPGPGYRAGGSYGGLGGTTSSPVKPAYGHPAVPVYLGGGGGEGVSDAPGGHGGGRVDITAADRVVVDGAIRANGNPGSGNQSGSGAGGSIRMRTALVKGAGTISADGGAYEVGGGGGRVAVEYNHAGVTGDDLNGLRNITAAGGHGNSSWGSAGTILLKRFGHAVGELVIDDNLTGATSPAWTPLTHIGFGRLQSIAADTFITDGTVPLLPGALVGITLNPNLAQTVTFTIVDNTATSIMVDVSGGIELTDVATAGDEYAAVYHFDALTFRRGGFLVLGDRLEVDDRLLIEEFGKLTHYDATTGFVSRLEVDCHVLRVEGSGSIDVSGRGYLGGQHEDNGDFAGRTVGNTLGASYHSAASHGGLGGATDGTPNPIYGDVTAPIEPGSGGSRGTGGSAGGDGGGCIRIRAVTAQVDGTVSADGQNGGGNNAGSGSGGSVFLDVGSLAGTGVIRANGAGNELGAGGGRIGVYYQSMDFDGSRFQVLGGQGNSRVGGNGSLFLKQAGQTHGDLVIDGMGGVTPFGSTEIPAGILFDNVTFRNQARVTVDDPLIVSNTLTLASGSMLTHSVEHEEGLQLEVGSLIIDPTSSIDVSARGYRGAWRDGNASPNGLTVGGASGPGYQAAASYGGRGGTSSAAINPVYGQPATPVHLGTGGGEGVSDAMGGNGGGRVRIVARDTVHVEGGILANGGPGAGNSAGSGSGGSIRIDTEVLEGSGIVAANGAGYEVGGGGGRIAVYHDAMSFDPSHFQALGGQGNGRAGGNGTLFLKQTSQSYGDLVVDGLGVTTPNASTPLPDGLVLDNIYLRNSARVEADHLLTAQQALALTADSALTHSIEQEDGLRVNADVVEVDATSRVDVSGRGYRGGWRDGNAGPNGLTLNGQPGPGYRAAASYGGRGGSTGTEPNPVYGHPVAPRYLGTGGGEGVSDALGGNGGGRIDLAAGTRMRVDGGILAGGMNGAGNQAGSGSGGSIRIETGLLEGAGTVAANGGAYEVGGGGGRVLVAYDTLGVVSNDLNGLRNVTAFGGHGNSSWGSAGTVVLKQDAQTFGDLVIDDNLVGQTSSVWTPLTPVGPGTIRELNADTLGMDDGVTHLPGSLAGLELNPNLSQSVTFTIVDNTATTLTVDVSGGTVLTDVASTGNVYAAVYRMDNVRFRRGGFLVLSDRLLVGGAVHVTENGVLTHPDATLAFQPRLDLEAGTVRVDSDAAIDVTGRGYLGGERGENTVGQGRTLNNTLGSTPRSGGSYGGLGGTVTGVPNPIYGNDAIPVDLGSGGSDGVGDAPGGDGGGRIRILTGNLVVDGGIRAYGAAGAGNGAGSGSGGSILIEAGALSGSGVIGADGGAYEVGGGGGRVAIYIPALSSDTNSLILRAAAGVGNSAAGQVGSVHYDGTYVWTGQSQFPYSSLPGGAARVGYLITGFETSPEGQPILRWTWDGVDGRSAEPRETVIEYTGDLMGTNWIPLTGPVTGDQWEGELPAGADEGFIRLRR